MSDSTRIILVIVGLGFVALLIAAFALKPDHVALKIRADYYLQEARDRACRGADVEICAAFALFSQVREDKYGDYLVATQYTVTAEGTIVLECYGLFGQIYCGRPPNNGT